MVRELFKGVKEDSTEMENNYLNKVVEQVLREATGKEGKNHIDEEEFEELMWTTGIDKSCVIYFDDRDI